MPLSKEQTIGYLKRRLPIGRGSDEEQMLIADIESWLPVSCRVLAERVSTGDRARRAKLEKAYSVTIASGVGSLAGAGYADLLVESLQGADIQISGNSYNWQWVPSEQDLRYQPPSDFIFFTVSANALKTRNTDGSRTTLAGTAQVANAVFVPKVDAVANNTTVPEILEAELLDILLVMAGQRLGVAPVETPAG